MDINSLFEMLSTNDFKISFIANLAADIPTGILTGIIVGILVNHLQNQGQSKELDRSATDEKEELYLRLAKTTISLYHIDQNSPKTAIHSRITEMLSLAPAASIFRIKKHLKSSDLILDSLLSLNRLYDEFIVVGDNMHKRINNLSFMIIKKENRPHSIYQPALMAVATARLIEADTESIKEYILNIPPETDTYIEAIFCQLNKSSEIQVYRESRNNLIDGYNSCVALLRHYYSTRPELFNIELMI